jgi:protein-tyrosine phosphatase
VTEITKPLSGKTARTDDADPITGLRPLALPAPVSGELWLTGLPNNDLRLRRHLFEAAEKGVTQFVILTEYHEIRDLAPDYARLLSSDGLNFSVMRLPIRDFGVPESVPAFRLATHRIADALQSGERIVMHCRGGIGRTGLVAEAVLIELGVPPAEARSLVAAAGSRCETAEQVAFLRKAYGNVED